MSSALRIGAYALVALVAGFELVVFWLMLNPDVPPDYRAYYIDKTTTCLNQPVSGAYVLGTTIDFTYPGRVAAKPLRVCGWEGPAGDGNHAVGTSSRLRFVYDEPATALRLQLRLVAVKKDTQPTQRVNVTVNNTALGTVNVAADPAQDFTFDLPAELVSAADGRIEVKLDLLDAVQMRPNDPDNRRRSIKLVSAALIPA